VLRRRLLFVLVLVPLALAAGLAAARAGSVSAQPIQFGVADDATKHAVDGGADLFQTIGDLGMTENRVTVWWDERSPDVLQERDFLDRMTSIARISGVRVVLAVQPLRARAFATDTDRKISLYAAYLERLARRYPSIRDYVIGNEPNQRRFLQPQHAADGAIVSAKIYERLIAASYDALRRVDPDIDVVGLATAPGGNDQRLGADNESVSPTRFIAALGSAYRASGRTRPLMDTVDVHAYAAKNDFPLTQRRMWPQAGPADLDRIKQAWWDAFHGTDQPLFEESGPGAQAAGGPVVRFRLDESGTQVLIDAGKVSPSLYRGKENIEPVSEAVQARYYADVVRLVECDSTVSSFLFFHLIDEPSLLGFQSGLLRVDGSRRPSYDSVRSAIADAGRCASPHAWRHTTSVAGARATFSLVDRPVTQRKFRVIVHAAEEVNAKAGVFPVADTRALTRETLAARLARGRSGALLEAATTVKGNGGRALVLRGALGPGRYAFAVLVRSTMNPDRTKLLLSGPFTVR
jgi:hypothetical protein